MVSRLMLMIACLVWGAGFCHASPFQETGSESPDTGVAASGPFTSEYLLPVSTKAWLSVPDLATLQAAVETTQFGAMARDEQLKEFVESIRAQFQNWLNEKNVRLGFRIEQLEEIQTGEICIAGVLQQSETEKLTRGSHGIVLLVDVTGSEEAAERLMRQVAANLKERGAVEEQMDDINGAKVTQFKLEKKQLSRVFTTYYTITDGWLLASDNLAAFRPIVQRIRKLNTDPQDCFGAQPAFKAVMENSQIGARTGHVRWFVDPFGYIKLAQAIQAEEQVIPQQTNNRAEILEKEGFDAFAGVGGQVVFAVTGDDVTDSELIHRTFLYAPRDSRNDEKRGRVFGLVDFENHNNLSLQPLAWVPPDVSTHLSLTWDLQKAFNNIGFVVDAFLGEETWDATMESLRTEPDMQVNLEELVGSFQNQITVATATERPIDEESERVVIGLPIRTGSEEMVFESIFRVLGRGDARKIKLAGIDVIVQDTTREPEVDPLEGLDELTFEDDPMLEEEEQEEDFQLFEKRYFAIFKQDDTSYLLLANNKDYLVKIMTRESDVTLAEQDDFQEIQAALGKLVDESKVSFRQFGRIAEAIEVNYEMLRQGKMGSSKTVLARVLNRAMETEETDRSVPRSQEIDGSKLPPDFEKSVAPYFGPSGWVLETEENGWRLSGCILKKKQVSEVVQAPEDELKR